MANAEERLRRAQQAQRAAPTDTAGADPAATSPEAAAADVAEAADVADAAGGGGGGGGVSEDKAPKVNITDLDSRIMHTPHGYIQGYNAQAAVNENGVVLAASVTQEANDMQQCEPMMAVVADNMGAANIDEPVGTMLFDAGYLSENNLAADGPDRLIATTKAWKLRRKEPTSGPPPGDAGPIEAMNHRLRIPEGAELYSKRQHTVEPVFANTKENRGYRRFVQRGLTAVQAEWQLITTAHNLRKLFDHGPSRQPG